ncbi:MAG: VOC family protein [Acidimicrobiaceae bacterium]|nr:VOC family protein [Acidimicrobiaceae bacterium]
MPRTLAEPRWTHIAIPVSNLERAIEFYTTLTPLVVVARHQTDDGRGAWLSNDKQVETPFVLVISEFVPEVARRFDLVPGEPHATLAPFAHIGIELPNKEDVDAMAERAREMGALHWEPRQMPEHIGYICAAKDPDGNVIEFSWNQQVYTKVQELWG